MWGPGQGMTVGDGSGRLLRCRCKAGEGCDSLLGAAVGTWGLGACRVAVSPWPCAWWPLWLWTLTTSLPVMLAGLPLPKMSPAGTIESFFSNTGADAGGRPPKLLMYMSGHAASTRLSPTPCHRRPPDGVLGGVLSCATATDGWDGPGAALCNFGQVAGRCKLNASWQIGPSTRPPSHSRGGPQHVCVLGTRRWLPVLCRALSCCEVHGGHSVAARRDARGGGGVLQGSQGVGMQRGDANVARRSARWLVVEQRLDSNSRQDSGARRREKAARTWASNNSSRAHSAPTSEAGLALAHLLVVATAVFVPPLSTIAQLSAQPYLLALTRRQDGGHGAVPDGGDDTRAGGL